MKGVTEIVSALDLSALTASSKKLMCETLKPEIVDQFKNDLEQQLEELLSRADSAVKVLVNDDSSASDPMDRATLDGVRDNILRIRERESRLIRKIKATLEKIEEGEFGICEACGKDIPIKRLIARPVASYCIRCKTKLETVERIAGL
jgi:DnaK suppressor protein